MTIRRTRRILSASIQTLSGAAIDESVVIVTMMMVFPSSMATVVMPSALVAVIPFIAITVTVTVSRGWRVDYRRGFVHDWGWFDVDRAGHTQKHSDVGVSESRAGCARSGNAHCQKKGSVFHRVSPVLLVSGGRQAMADALDFRGDARRQVRLKCHICNRQ